MKDRRPEKPEGLSLAAGLLVVPFIGIRNWRRRRWREDDFSLEHPFGLF